MIFANIFGGEAAAQTFTYPHGSASGSSQLCSVCHTMHDSTGSELLKDAPESALCFTCHNGTGSVYDVQSQMNLDPGTNAMHPINVNLNHNPGIYTYTPVTTAGIAPPAPYECSTCHNPHRDYGFGSLLRWNYDNTSEYVAYPGSPDPYAACHYSPHGVANSELVRFNPAFVGPSAATGSGPAYVDKGNHSGSCTLSCHGVDHAPANY